MYRSSLAETEQTSSLGWNLDTLPDGRVHLSRKQRARLKEQWWLPFVLIIAVSMGSGIISSFAGWSHSTTPTGFRSSVFALAIFVFIMGWIWLLMRQDEIIVGPASLDLQSNFFGRRFLMRHFSGSNVKLRLVTGFWRSRATGAQHTSRALYLSVTGRVVLLERMESVPTPGNDPVRILAHYLSQQTGWNVEDSNT